MSSLFEIRKSAPVPIKVYFRNKPYSFYHFMKCHLVTEIVFWIPISQVEVSINETKIHFSKG